MSEGPNIFETDEWGVWNDPAPEPAADDFVLERADAISICLLGGIAVILAAILTKLAGWW